MCNAWNHPPGCTCGWGGGGSGGLRYISLSARTAQSEFKKWRPYDYNNCSFVSYHSNHSDFCRSTSCRDCGATVYLIHHNGGYVLVEELGWPWPIHPCFENRQEAKRNVCLDCFKSLESCTKETLSESGLSAKPQLSLVVSITNFRSSESNLCLTTAEDGRLFYCKVESHNQFKPGDIVGVFNETKQIVSSKGSKHKFVETLDKETFFIPSYDSIDFDFEPEIHKFKNLSSTPEIFVKLRVFITSSEGREKDYVFVPIKFAKKVIKIEEQLDCTQFITNGVLNMDELYNPSYKYSCRYLTKEERNKKLAKIANLQKELDEFNKNLMKGLHSNIVYELKLKHFTSQDGFELSSDHTSIYEIGI